MERDTELTDLSEDLLHQVLSRLPVQDKCRLALVCRRLCKVAGAPEAWREVEAPVTARSLAWLLRRAGSVSCLTLKSPLALDPALAPSFESQVLEVLRQASSVKQLRLWGPPVALSGLPETVVDLRLDFWRYESEQIRALAQLSRLHSLTIHFLGVGHSALVACPH